MSNIAAFSQATNYICLRDVKAAATNGGTFTQDAWRTRVLTEETVDYGNHCALASNQFILDAGTYICWISCPAAQVGRHKARLQNITGGATLLLGTSEFSLTDGAAYTVQSRSFISGIFTVAAAQTLEVQHYCENTNAGEGFGLASNFSVSEIYTIAEFLKVA